MPARTGPLTLAELAAAAAGPDAGGWLARQLYAELPDVYRRVDDGSLEALLEAVARPLGVLVDLADAIIYRAPDEGGTPGDTSILVDPAETPWPAWLARTVGVDLARAMPDVAASSPAARAAIADARAGWRAGSRGALVDAALAHLTGDRVLRIRDHAGADPWVLTVSTRAAETPDPAALEAELRRVLAAGFDLELDNAVGTWDGIEALGDWATLEATAPTWADVEQLDT